MKKRFVLEDIIKRSMFGIQRLKNKLMFIQVMLTLYLVLHFHQIQRILLQEVLIIQYKFGILLLVKQYANRSELTILPYTVFPIHQMEMKLLLVAQIS